MYVPVVLLLVAQPAIAQHEHEEADSVVVEKKKEIIFLEDDGERRVKVRTWGDPNDIDFDIDIMTLQDEYSFLSGSDGMIDMVLDGLDQATPGLWREYSTLRQMEMETRRLARSLRMAEGDERDRQRAELQEKLQKIFDYKQQMRQERIDRLRAMLEEETEEHAEREALRQEIIERRLQELIGESRYAW